VKYEVEKTDYRRPQITCQSLKPPSIAGKSDLTGIKMPLLIASKLMKTRVRLSWGHLKPIKRVLPSD
jgi:hypothetical protein